MKLEDYIPERFDEQHIKVLVRTEPCATCKHPTVANIDKSGRYSPFPAYHRATFMAQIARSEVRLVGGRTGDGDPVCVDCNAAGAIMCECALCKVEKKSNEMKESIGSLYPDYLCQACYETVPAKTWGEKLAKLEEKHRYDWC